MRRLTTEVAAAPVEVDALCGALHAVGVERLADDVAELGGQAVLHVGVAQVEVRAEVLDG